METDLVSNLSNFLKEEKIMMELQKTSDSEFWLESPEGFMTVRFSVDEDAHERSQRTKQQLPCQHRRYQG